MLYSPAASYIGLMPSYIRFASDIALRACNSGTHLNFAEGKIITAGFARIITCPSGQSSLFSSLRRDVLRTEGLKKIAIYATLIREIDKPGFIKVNQSFRFAS